MNYALVLASLLAAATAAIHVFVGGQDIATPLLASSLASEPKLVLYACWHAVSVATVLSAAALFIGALPGNATSASSMVVAISIWWLATGVVFLAVIATQPGDGLLWLMPQWLLLLPVGLLGLWGARRMRQSAPAGD